MNAMSLSLSHTSHLVYLADLSLHCREQLFFYSFLWPSMLVYSKKISRRKNGLCELMCDTAEEESKSPFSFVLYKV